MINVPASNITSTAAEPVVRPARRIGVGGRAFWIMFAIEALLIATLLAVAVMALLPTRAPLSGGPDYAAVREATVAYLNGTTPDTLVDLGPGVVVRSSNLRGFSLNGSTYYYIVEGEYNADPLSRGAVADDQVEIVLRDKSGPKELVIYRLISKERSTN